MRSQLLRARRGFSALLLALLTLAVISCKKETVEVTVDAFAKTDIEVKQDPDAFKILFTLQPYPYAEAGVRTGPNKSLFYEGAELSYHRANELSENRFGIFLDPAFGDKDFYYQIYVKDTQSTKEIYSEVFLYRSK